MTRFGRTSAALVLVLLPLASSASVASAADAPTPVPLASSGASPSATAAPGTGKVSSPQILPTPAYGTIGTRIQVTGAGFPATTPVQVALCGNLALNGSSDCDSAGAGSTTTNNRGEFFAYFTVGRPPKPCPCVVLATGFATTQSVKVPFDVQGVRNGAVGADPIASRQITASMRLSGTNATAWIGGPAKRTLVLKVKNTGSAVLDNPSVTLTAGQGADPTELLKQVQLQSIAPGQSIEYRLPVTFKAPAIGQYRVKAQFIGLDKLTSTTATTSSYPWVLIILGWLLLQPLLLGLYKRRPIAETGPEDPFAMGSPPPGPLPVGTYGSAALDDDPLGGYVPAGVGAGALVGAVAYGAPAGASTAIAPRPPSALVPGYRPVFGVTDLRSYLDPSAPSGSPTVAPRIVLGGIVPTANGVNGSNGINGSYDAYEVHDTGAAEHYQQ